MGNYFVPSKGPDAWWELLRSENQCKKGYSAYEMAKCWEAATHFPTCVERAFNQSQDPLFHNLIILYGFPEYKVKLLGGSTSSQNDLYLLAKANNELMTIMVEGKVSESFGETVEKWKGQNPSEGKVRRLAFLLDVLLLNEANILNKRYQLLHRTASAIIEASRVNAKHALMLVHSFNEKGKGFEDYAEFVKLFNLSPSMDAVTGPVLLNGVNLYFGWVTGEKEK